MTFRKRRKGILIILLVFVSIIPQVRANPVPMYISGFFMAKLVFLFIITFSLESFIIRVFIGPNDPSKTSAKFYKSVFAVNLVTFPLTQLFAFTIYQSFVLDYSFALFISIIIEVFPITLECLLYLKIYKKFNILSYFVDKAENKTILKSTITANLVTFMIGIPIFLI